MINIEKDGTKYTVSKESYEIYFKPIGFEIIEDKKETKSEDKKEVSKKQEKEAKVGDKK